MRATLFLLVTTAFVGSLLAQYNAHGCTRHVTLPSSSYSIPTYQPQCQCQCYQPQPPRVNVVPYNYCQPTYMQQNIVPQSCPVYQSAPIIVPMPPPPKDCECAHTTVQKQPSEPRPPRPAPTPPSGHRSIPGLSDADSKNLVPNLGNIGHNHPVVVQSVIVGKKSKEKDEKETEEEKGEKDKNKGECSQKKRRPKKKCSEEVEDDDDEERSYRRKRRRRVRKHRRQNLYDPYDSYSPFDPESLDERCAECSRNNGNPPVIMYYNR